MADKRKLRVAFYWAAACGGCDVAVLDLGADLWDVAAAADIYFWPIALDFKYRHLEELEDGFLDACFFNGAVRNAEQRHLAQLLRRKSRILVAFGSCACFGGIPGLANFYTAAGILERVYQETPSTVNPERIRPQPRWQALEGELRLPEFFDRVYTLPQVVPVDYLLPGCPPPVDLIAGAVNALAQGDLPPLGSTLAPDQALCETCPRVKEEKKIRHFQRVHQVLPDPQRCLLEQGIVCCGPATRSGCGARCLAANMPCRGCFGPTSRVVEQGAALVSALASILDSQDEAEIKAILEGLADPAGLFYRFGLPASLLETRVPREEVERACAE